MIRAIELNTTSSESFINEYKYKLEFLQDIRHINIFVGENNSGKSRFMRSLVNSKDAELLTDEIKIQSKDEVQRLRERIKAAFEKVKTEYEDITISEQHDEMTAAELYAYYKTYVNSSGLLKRTYSNANQTFLSETERVISDLRRIVKQNTTRGQVQSFAEVTKVYIPVLRGVESFNLYFDISNNAKINSISMNYEQREALDEYKDNAGKIYGNKISSVYKIGSSQVFTGENLYKEIQDKLLGDEPGRIFIHEFEEFISNNFYDGEGFVIIPHINKGYLKIKIGDSEERALHELGDGIKQMICILYKIFELKDNEAFFFIEEPEISLHPGYQRKLIDILQQPEFEKLYFFITTHSNHFVDRYFESSNNISIYKFFNVNKNNNLFQVEHTAPGDIELLNALGVNNSSVFMANATVWVEGLSDKIYLEKYLEIFMREKGINSFKEGVDYSFVEYSGNNITHWSFDDYTDDERIKASSITNRAMIIVDNDNDSKQKQRRKEKLKKTFGERYIELSVREIENTISKDVLEKTLFGEGGVIYKEGMRNSRKSFNTKNAFIWEYIDQHYIIGRGKNYWDKTKKRPKVDKVQFAKSICKNISTIEDMSNEALRICEDIYSFLETTYNDINEAKEVNVFECP